MFMQTDRRLLQCIYNLRDSIWINGCLIFVFIYNQETSIAKYIWYSINIIRDFFKKSIILLGSQILLDNQNYSHQISYGFFFCMLICDQALKLKQVVFVKKTNLLEAHKGNSNHWPIYFVWNDWTVKAVEFLMCVLKYNDI